MTTIRTKKVVRYAIGSNLNDQGKDACGQGSRGSYYVIDLLTTAPHETDPKKGWFRKISTVKAAVKKLNAADEGGPYVTLSNGYVDLAGK